MCVMLALRHQQHFIAPESLQFELSNSHHVFCQIMSLGHFIKKCLYAIKPCSNNLMLHMMILSTMNDFIHHGQRHCRLTLGLPQTFLLAQLLLCRNFILGLCREFHLHVAEDSSCLLLAGIIPNQNYILYSLKNIAAVRCMFRFVSNVRLCNRHTNVNSYSFLLYLCINI